MYLRALLLVGLLAAPIRVPQGSVGSPAKPVTSAEAELKSLEAERSRVQVAGDTKRLDELLASEFVEVNAAGVLRTKAQNIQGHQTGDARWERFDLVDLQVEAQQETAVVHGHLIRKGTYAGRDLSGENHYTRYFIRRDGRWQAIFQYSVPIH